VGVENTEVGSLSEQEGGSQRGRRGVRVDEGGPACKGAVGRCSLVGAYHVRNEGTGYV